MSVTMLTSEYSMPLSAKYLFAYVQYGHVGVVKIVTRLECWALDAIAGLLSRVI
jgi:hypothetical protein